MYDYEKLMLIAEYLDVYERNMYREVDRASYDIKLFVQAQLSVVSEIIDYVEGTTGISLRTSY